MKKLLSLLGAVAISASAGTAVVSCSYGPSINKVVNREKKFYSTVSAEALKAGILADQNLNIGGKENVGINEDFATTYLSSKTVKDAFRNLYGKNQGAAPDETSEVSSLFTSVFGTNQGGYHYTVANSYGSLKENNGVKSGTNLGDMVYNGTTDKDNSRLLQPAASVSSTLNLISGGGNIVFKNDFDPSMGATLISLLTSGTVKKALNDESIPPIFKMVDTILTTNADKISSLVKSITQTEVAAKNTNTYSQQLSESSNDLFGSLIYLITNKAYKFNKDNANKDNGLTALLKYFLGEKQDKIADLTPAEYALGSAQIVKEKDNKKINDLVLSFTGAPLTSDPTIVATYTDATGNQVPVKTPLKYERSKDEKGTPLNTFVFSDINSQFEAWSKELPKGTNPQFTLTMMTPDKKPMNGNAVLSKTDKGISASIVNTNYNDLLGSVAGIASFAITLIHYFRQFDRMYPKLVAPMDGNHIFKDDETNGEAIQNVMNSKYVDANDIDDFWYTSGSGTDTKYYTRLNLQNLISDLQYYLSPVDGSGHQTLRALTILLGGPTGSLNPILENFYQAISGFGKDLLKDKISSLPIIGSSADAIVNAIFEIGHSGLEDIINWLTSDGYDPQAQGVKNLLQNITSVLGNIDLTQFADGDTKEILEIVQGIIKYLNTSDGDKFYSHPWQSIYSGGLLYSVGKIMGSVASDDKNPDSISRISYALKNLRDLRTILTMNLSDLLDNLSVMTGSSISLPDWLYSGHNKSLADLFNYLADDWLVYIQGAGTKEQTAHNSNAYNTLDENKYYSFNSRALANVVDSLIPATDLTDTSRTRIVDKDNKPVTPVMPLYYSIMNYGQTIKPNTIGTYYTYLAGSSDKKEILSDTPFEDVNDPGHDKNAKVNVSSQAFEYLLGLDDTTSSSRLFFRPGSLLMSVSNLYGHWYGDITGTGNKADQKVDSDEIPLYDKNGNLSDETANGNANASESIFSLLSDLAAFSTKSIDQLTNDQYAKYFDPKNWKLSNIKQTGLDAIVPNAGDVQTLSYDLSFCNPDANNQWFTYHVEMQRNAVPNNNTAGNSETGWVVKQLMRQN